MYSVSITNNYSHPLFMDGGNQIIAAGGGGTAKLDKWGSHALNVAWMGDINFMDLSDKKLSGYTNPKLPWTNATWGGLIRYRGLDAYFRYEGGGQVNLVIDPHGCVELSFPQGGMIIRLNDLTVT